MSLQKFSAFHTLVLSLALIPSMVMCDAMACGAHGELTGPFFTALGFLLVAPLFIHFFSMLLDALHNDHFGWALAILFLSPVASLLYYFSVYEKRTQLDPAA